MTTKNEYPQEVIELAKHYHKWVAWSDEDNCYVGQCPDLGIACHYENNPTNEAETYQDMLNLIYDVIVDGLSDEDLPKPTFYAH